MGIVIWAFCSAFTYHQIYCELMIESHFCLSNDITPKIKAVKFPPRVALAKFSISTDFKIMIDLIFNHFENYIAENNIFPGKIYIRKWDHYHFPTGIFTTLVLRVVWVLASSWPIRAMCSELEHRDHGKYISLKTEWFNFYTVYQCIKNRTLQFWSLSSLIIKKATVAVQCFCPV